MDLRKELSDIKGILKDNPRGMTVTEISKEIKMNRHSVAKYMDMLVISGHVEMKSFGSSKVFYLSRRLPMSAILNFSSDFIIILNKDLEIINVNDRFLAFENIEKQDILDKSIINSSFPMEFNPSIIPNIKEALAGKESTIEAYLKKDDAPYYFTVKLVPTVFDDTEKGVTIIFEDITERKNAETALKISEERFRAIFEHAAVGIAYLAKDGRFLRMNQRYCDILGYTKDELSKLNNIEITHPEDMQASVECFNQFTSGSINSCSMEKRFIKKDANPKNLVALQKVCIVAIGVVAFLLATQLKSVLEMSFFAYTIYGVAITPALIAALAWKRVTKAGGLASIIAGSVVCLVFFALSKIPGIPAPDGDPWGIPLIYPSLIASLGALVIVSLMTPKPKPEELERFFPKKAGEGEGESCPGPVNP